MHIAREPQRSSVPPVRLHVATPTAWPRSRARQDRGFRVAFRGWWQAAEIDRQLAAGVSSRTSPLHELRALKLTTPRARRRLAAGLAGALRRARDTHASVSSAVRPHAAEVIAARAVFAALDRRLREEQPVTPRGMAMLQELLTDGAGPLYQPSEPGALGSRLRAAAAALDPGK
jgi:hypothetical protein